MLSLRLLSMTFITFIRILCKRQISIHPLKEWSSFIITWSDACICISPSVFTLFNYILSNYYSRSTWVCPYMLFKIAQDRSDVRKPLVDSNFSFLLKFRNWFEIYSLKKQHSHSMMMPLPAVSVGTLYSQGVAQYSVLILFLVKSDRVKSMHSLKNIIPDHNHAPKCVGLSH